MTTTTTRTPLIDVIAGLREGGDEAILAAVHDIAPELAARAAENDRLGTYPEESIAILWSTGLGALTIPVESGGLGASLSTTARAIEGLGRADAGTTLVFVWTLLFHRLIHAPGAAWPEALVKKVTDDALAGPSLSNFLNVEPALGTSARGGLVATTARPVTLPDGSPGWRINGQKIYSTGSYGLRWLVTTAQTGPEDPEGLRVGTFLIAADTPGVSIVDTWDHFGMRATVSNDFVFEDVDVPFDHAIGLRPFTGGPPQVLGNDHTGTLASTSVLILAIYNGVAKASRDFLVKYLNERTPTNLGAPLSSLPRFQQTVGEIESLIYDNDRLIYGFAESFDRNRADAGTPNAAPPPSRNESSLIKVLVTRNVIRSTELALSLTGNPGLSRHNPLERHYRDALCLRVHTPQDDLVLLETGKIALGIGSTNPLVGGSKPNGSD
jgi:alkylation response protein AidB-like acyl-CoA dehydrogenase